MCLGALLKVFRFLIICFACTCVHVKLLIHAALFKVASATSMTITAPCHIVHMFFRNNVKFALFYALAELFGVENHTLPASSFAFLL